MKIDIICVGKIKESFMREAADEYIKRLSRYINLNIIELPDEPTPENASAAQEMQIKEKEGERILSKLSDGAYKIALAIEGKSLSSEEFASEINELGVSGHGHIQFIIGGSLGLSPAVMKKANYKLSFSRMTFPHQLMRVILLEQIYRAYRIINNQPYHK